MVGLRMLGENVRQHSFSPLSTTLKVDNPKYHTPTRSYVVTALGILVQSVVSFYLGQPFVATLPHQNILIGSKYPTNHTIGG